MTTPTSLSKGMITRAMGIIKYQLQCDPNTMTDQQMFLYRGIGRSTLEAIRLLTDPNIQFCPHCGRRIDRSTEARP